MNSENLIKMAINAMSASYSPYSRFSVGAALLCKNGEIFTGCNIENSSFSATVCAERVAISAAIAQKKTEFEAIAIVGGKDGKITDYCTPCGVCRQVLSEFCSPDFKIILFNGKEYSIKTLGSLLPEAFGSKNLCE